MAIEHFSSGGQVAHEAFKLHVALREADVAGRDIGALCIRVALRDTKRLLVVGLVLVLVVLGLGLGLGSGLGLGLGLGEQRVPL